MSEWKEKHCFTESVFDEGNVARPYAQKDFVRAYCPLKNELQIISKYIKYIFALFAFCNLTMLLSSSPVRSFSA